MSETTESLQQKENVHREYDIELPGTARPSRTERETLRLACQILGNEGHSDNLAGLITIQNRAISILPFRHQNSTNISYP
jgi:hypothetical protein